MSKCHLQSDQSDSSSLVTDEAIPTAEPRNGLQNHPALLPQLTPTPFIRIRPIRYDNLSPIRSSTSPPPTAPDPSWRFLPILNPSEIMKMFRLRRKEAPWEVVDNKFVDPSPTYYGADELDIDTVSQTDIKGTYVFDMKTRYSGIQDLQRAVTFSRQQLLREAFERGFNVLLVESWQLTIFQKAKHRRIEVRYSGRPARVVGDASSNENQSPPFIGILYA